MLTYIINGNYIEALQLDALIEALCGLLVTISQIPYPECIMK